MKKRDFSLKAIIKENSLQKIQDNFSFATGIGMLMVDAEGKPLTSPSGESKLCQEALRGHSRNELFGGYRCLPTFLGGEGVVDKDLSYICELDVGMHNFVVPLRFKDNTVAAYAVLGPAILIMRKSKEEYRKIAENIGMDIEELWSALLEVKIVSLHGIQSLINLVRDVGEFIIHLSLRNYMHQQGREVVQVSEQATQLNKVLHDLLEVAFEVSKADVGSVMFVGADCQHFTIKASKGIPEDIAKNARVKIGEGIAGIVAKDAAPLLIDNNNRDTRLKPYLNRPQLASSMVFPIKVKNRVSGIMNLGALETSTTRFTLENINLMKRLIDLATVAIV